MAFERDSWELSCFGYQRLVDPGVDVYANPWNYLSVLSNSAFFLTHPHVIGLGSTPLVSEQQVRVGLRSGVEVDRGIAYPFEVGRFLAGYYSLPLPGRLDYDVLDEVYRSKSFSEARNLLAELVRATKSAKWSEATTLAGRVG